MTPSTFPSSETLKIRPGVSKFSNEEHLVRAGCDADRITERQSPRRGARRLGCFRKQNEFRGPVARRW